MPHSVGRKEQEVESLVLRSDEYNEVISRVPSWLIRWGITVFFLMLVLMVLGSYLIKYPDIVKVPFHLTSQHAPKPVVARLDGKLVKLFLEENQPVKQNQVVAFLESTAALNDVSALKAWLNQIAVLAAEDNLERVESFTKPTLRQLGELQPDYLVFDGAYTELLSFLPRGFYQNKKELLERDLVHLGQLRAGLEKRRALHEKDLELAKDEYAIQTALFRQNVISLSDFKREESKLLAKEVALQQVEASMVENLTSQTAKRKELLELGKLSVEQRNMFIQALNLMKSAVDNWEQKFLLRAPVDGTIHFNSFIQENQNLQIGQEIFYVTVENRQEFGEVVIPQYNMGKVRVGQEVLIRFDSYPFQEFGFVKGRIAFISQIPNKEGGFLAKVSLPDGLVTTHGKRLTFRDGMSATSQVITENSRLMEKIFHGLKAAFSR